MEKDDDKNTHPARWSDTGLPQVFDRLFDERMWLEPFPKMLSRFDRSFFPRVDIKETDTVVKVVADVPGIDSEDIDIEVRGNHMRISGKTEREYESKDDERPYRYERSFGSFRRELTLPARVQDDQVKAVCKDGVLTITMLKVDEEKRKKKIAIEKK